MVNRPANGPEPEQPAELNAKPFPTPQPPQRRQWRAPALERLPLAETRFDAGSGVDGTVFSSIPG